MNENNESYFNLGDSFLEFSNSKMAAVFKMATSCTIKIEI